MKRKSATTAVSKSKRHTIGPNSIKSIFKMPIESIPVNEDGVPYFMPIVINRILDNMQIEGIFRQVGNKNRIDYLGKRAFESDFKIDEDITIHDLTSFIKQWLVELPVPIIVPHYVNKYYKDDTIRSTKRVLRHIPEVNRKCIAMIFSTLILISDQSAVNLMTLDNIMLCTLPSITQSYKDIKVKFDMTTFFNHCIELMNVDGNDFLISSKKE